MNRLNLDQSFEEIATEILLQKKSLLKVSKKASERASRLKNANMRREGVWKNRKENGCL